MVSSPSRYTVKDVMTSTVVAVPRDAPFKEIATVMRQRRITGVPVLDSRNRVLGVVTEADLLRKEELRDKEPMLLDEQQRLGDYAKAGAVNAADLMTSPAITTTSAATLPQAARLMAVHGYKRLPVVDDAGVLRGIISRADLLKVFLRPDDDIASEIRREVVNRLFPLSRHSINVDVSQGHATLQGLVEDIEPLPLAERLTQAVEGVVDVRCHLAATQQATDNPPP